MRENVRFGVRVELATVVVVLLGAALLRPEAGLPLLRTWLLMVVAMTAILYFTLKPGESMFLGHHRGGRGTVLVLALVPALVLLVLACLPVVHASWTWVAALAGLWLGQRTGWLLKNRSIA
ncbi:MAG: hypothetical protein C0P65_011405 [Lysobacteraceae bacterium]